VGLLALVWVAACEDDGRVVGNGGPRDAQVIDGPTSGDARDAGGDTRLGSLGTERPPPSERCMARCIWDLIAPCRVDAPCFEERMGDGMGADSVTCYPGWGFRVVSSSMMQAPPVYLTVNTYKPDGRVCFTTEWMMDESRRYLDSSGRVVATVSSVYSAPVTVTCADGRTSMMDFESTACEAELARQYQCTFGSCP
jgi:hypothetical protein